DMPTAGLCIESGTGTGVEGDPCDDVSGIECGDGLLCVGAAGSEVCMSLCECPGGGLDAEGFCMTAQDCGAGGICINFNINDSVGLCMLF
ncbi:MAG TPA: hypothetical protein VGD74_10315, partial [Vulgatibacter sp.]